MKNVALLLRRSYVVIFILCSHLSLNAQYEFDEIDAVDHTSIKSQDRTGTCWSFSTASFVESELIRNGFGNLDLSEMFVVRNIYLYKAKNYILRQGKANFSQGALAHDLLNSASIYGIVPEHIYAGKMEEDNIHNHTEMVNALKGFLDGVLKKKPISNKWINGFEGILDAYLGEIPDTFNIEGQSFTPVDYAKHLGIKASDYVHISSFQHHPYYKSFILEVPDNYSNGSYFNLPLDEMMELIDEALKNGFSLTWDGDVSEKGFNAKQGVAIMPNNPDNKEMFENPSKELSANPGLRQEYFNQLKTTDDHLMHIIGNARDQNGTKYYLIKNSWGEISPFKGKLYMSDSYMRLKTVAITVHKKALTQTMRDKLGIK